MAALLVIERWRGQWALKRWKNQMTANGEVFEDSQLWPPLSSRSVEFSNQLSQLAGKSWGRLGNYWGQFAPIVAVEPGQFRRGSQETLPPLFKGNFTNTWQDLDQLMTENGPRFQSLRELMNYAPAAVDYDGVGQRMGAQAFQAAAMSDLHKGDRSAAIADLAALLSFAKFNEQDPTFVNYMIRIAIVRLSVDVCWDALQADGWTESELAAFQRACLDNRRLLSQLPRALEVERVLRLHQLEWLRSHSYASWTERYRKTCQAFGYELSPTQEGGFTRRQVFHPLWSFAWADQEELEYSRHAQREISALRDAARQRSWLQLKEQIAVNHQGYRAPVAAWRFYTKLPIVDSLLEVVGDPKAQKSKMVPDVKDPVATYPYTDFSKAWETSMKNLTLHELVITAIALKRYELEHGTPPTRLDDLVPDFLAALPTDFMDGHPLRYRRNADDSFTLYSIGDDLKDDGGDFLLKASATTMKNASPWSGNDWVWPRATRAKTPQVADASVQSGDQ